MKNYSLLIRDQNQWRQLMLALEYLEKDYEWVGIFQIPAGAYHAIRAFLTDEQVVLLKLSVADLEIHEVFYI